MGLLVFCFGSLKKRVAGNIIFQWGNVKRTLHEMNQFFAGLRIGLEGQGKMPQDFLR